MTDASEPKPGAPSGPPATSTHFLFQNKVFSVPGSYFAIAEDTREPTFYVPLGDIQGVLSIPQLVSGFDVRPGSSDEALLRMVEKALAHVRRVAPGDPIPSELLDGGASWQVDDRHRMVAENRLALQLASWVAGGKSDVRDLGELLKMGTDPAVRAKVQAAITKLAQRLGLGTARRQEVLDRINQLATELSYIEALRDRFASLKAIALKLHQLQSLYGAERGLADEVARVLILMRKPAADYEMSFTQIDTRTGDIWAMLLNFDDEVKFIRDRRDEIHGKFMMWDDLIRRWQNLVVEMSPTAEALLRDTYRFMARNFPQSSDWQLQFGSVQSRK